MTSPGTQDELRALVRQVVREELNRSDERGGISDVEAWTGLDRSTIFRKCKARAFPAATYLGCKRVWLRSDVEAWIRNQQSNPRPGARGIAAQKKGTAEHEHSQITTARRPSRAGRHVDPDRKAGQDVRRDEQQAEEREARDLHPASVTAPEAREALNARQTRSEGAHDA